MNDEQALERLARAAEGFQASVANTATVLNYRPEWDELRAALRDAWRVLSEAKERAT